MDVISDKASEGSPEASLKDGKIPGGNYTATQNTDGTWNLHAVPIFAEFGKGERKNKKAVGKKFMETAIAKARERLSEGYLAPLHINHHDDGQKVFRAGFFMPTHVGTVTMEGEEKDTLFADLRNIPTKIFNMIEQGMLPYRSVEIMDFSKPEISSLALLDDEVPFFRLPMTTVGKKFEKETTRMSKEEPALAMCASESGGLILFRFRKEDSMPKDTPDVKLAQDEEDKKEPAKVEGDEKREKEDMQEAPAGDPVQAEILEILKAIAANMGIVKQEGNLKDNEVAPITTDRGSAPAEEAAVALKAGEPEVKMSARLCALEAKDAARDKKESITKMVAVAEKDLHGYPVTDEVRANLFKYAGAGSVLLNTFVADYKANVPQDAPEGFTGEAVSAKGYRDEVMKFSADGTDSLKRANELASQWDTLTQKRITKMTLERYLEINMVKV